MNQKILSGLTATLLIATLGTPLASSANPIGAVDQVAKANLNQASTQAVTAESAPVNAAAKADQQLSQAALKAGKVTALNQTPTPDLQLTRTVVKLGEQPQATTAASAARETIAKIQAHNLAGRKAATLYVRNIPILTLTDSGKPSATTVKAPLVKMGSRQPTATENAIATAKSLNSANGSDDSSAATVEPATQLIEVAVAQPDITLSQSDPVLRAAAIAARINQLNRDGVDASTIIVSWNPQSVKAATGEQYAIKASKTLIAVINASTVLPDTTRSLEKDALQVTNRLRRLLGNAAPLASVSGKPNNWSQVALGSMRLRLSGMASWYGPGFNGSPSASGETFNQNAMTAAHRTLPFGTQVSVTNLNNGRSVVVKINDRGPYAGDRVIDLSAAAARMLGLIQSGVAPVRLDIMDDRPAAITATGN